MKNDNQTVFFELLRAGLWEKETRLLSFEKIDFEEVYKLALEQSVAGLVAAGLEHVEDVKVPLRALMPFMGVALNLEQRNVLMNKYIEQLIGHIGKAGIKAVLVKGQGVAQCYERPLWRTCGDVDLLLEDDDYKRAKELLRPLATEVETEYTHIKHLGMTIDGWMVELHGTLHSRLSRRVDKQIDAIQADTFNNGKVRKWKNGETVVLLPEPNNDVIFVFTHILHHFFFEGIGLRQICDWCRLLSTYKDSLNRKLLESRIQKMGLMSEWKSFAAFAIMYLGMPAEAMPFYNVRNKTEDYKWRRKADKICEFVLKVGNFGYKKRRDFSGMSYLRRKFVSFWGRLSDMLRHFRIFPLDSIRFFGGVLRSGLHAAVRGE